MSPLYRYSIRHPRKVLVLAFLVTVAVGPGIARLTLRTDGHALIPRGSKAIATDDEIRRAFGVYDPFVVMIEANDPTNGVFNPHTVALVERLTERLRAIPGVDVSNLISLDTEYNFRVRPGTLQFRRLLEPLPENEAELQRLRADIAKIRLYTGTLVSRDGPPASCAAIMIGASPDRDRIALHGQIQRVLAEHGGTPETYHLIGAPVAEGLLGTHILEDLGVPRRVLGVGFDRGTGGWAGRTPHTFYEFRRLLGRFVGLLPLAMGLMAVLFVVCFRSLVAASLPLLEIGACLVFVFGLMGFCGVPIYLTIAVLPLVLLASGVADEIHVFTRYVHNLVESTGRPHREVLQSTFDEMALPVIKASLTTAIGCASFALSPLAPVRAFGIFAAVGVLFCMFWSLTVVPAQLALLSPALFVRPGSLTFRRAFERSAFARIAAGALRFRWAIVALVLVALGLAWQGAKRVDVQDSWIRGFAPESEFYRSTQQFNDLFLGTHFLLVRIDAGHYTIGGTTGADSARAGSEFRPMADPVVLRRIKALEEFISGHTPLAVADAHGPARYLETTAFMVGGQAEARRVLPDSGTEARWLWDQYRRIRGEAKLRQVVDETYTQGLITVFLNDANFRDTALLMEDVRRYEREHLRPYGITLDFGGDVAVSQAIIDGIVTTQVRSLLGSLVGVLIVTVVLGRSLVWGALSVVPCMLAVLVNFAMMGWTGMPLGVATSMFTGMTLGMGVDYAIHVVEHYRRIRRRGKSSERSSEKAIIETVAATGPPICINALAVAGGFGVLMLSQVPANARLGGLVVVSLATCVAATLFLLPVLMRFVDGGKRTRITNSAIANRVQ